MRESVSVPIGRRRDPDHVLGVFARERLNEALSATHRAGFGPNTRVFDGQRTSTASQLSRAGLEIAEGAHPGPGDLVIVAGRPSMGKTSLALNIAEHVAVDQGLPVAVFSMEMGASQLAVRIVGSIGRIDQGHLRTGKLTDEEWPRLTEAIEKLRNISLHIDESAGLTSSELRANARRLARQCGQLGLIVVDYLQLMTSPTKTAQLSRQVEVAEISMSIKQTALELNVPMKLPNETFPLMLM